MSFFANPIQNMGINYQPPKIPTGVKMHDVWPYLGKVTGLVENNPPHGKPKSWAVIFTLDDGTQFRAILHEGRKFFEVSRL